MWDYVGMLTVGVIWGLTNAFMEVATKKFVNKEKGRCAWLYDIVYLILDW